MSERSRIASRPVMLEMMIEREIVASNVALRAQLQQQTLLAQLAGEIGNAGGAKRVNGAFRPAVRQIDHRQARRDLRAGRALQTIVDLVLQQVGGLIEQVDRNQPVRKPADHLVAAPTDRRQLAEFVEQGKRIDRRQVVGRPARNTCAKASTPPPDPDVPPPIGRQQIGGPHRPERTRHSAPSA